MRDLLRAEKALGGSGTRALIKAQMEKERREVAAADAGANVGKLVKNKAAAKRIAKCVPSLTRRRIIHRTRTVTLCVLLMADYVCVQGGEEGGAQGSRGINPTCTLNSGSD